MCHLSQVEGGLSRIVNKVISREIPRLRAAIVRACLLREIFGNARDEENRGHLFSSLKLASPLETYSRLLRIIRAGCVSAIAIAEKLITGEMRRRSNKIKFYQTRRSTHTRDKLAGRGKGRGQRPKR